jgi:hypothetical protein
VDYVFLDVHVEHQVSRRPPLLLVSEAQRREALWCAVVDTSLWVQRPPDLLIGHHIDLAHEVLVGLLRLLTNPNVLFVNYVKKGNYMKKMRVNVTYPPEAPQRPHRVTVCGVNVI